MSSVAKRLVFCVLVAGLTVVASDIPPNGSRLQASSGPCVCTGSVDAYEYGSGYVGTIEAGYELVGTATNNVQCAASMCQQWIWQWGSTACGLFNLNDDVGYVILDWHWYFSGLPWDDGQLVQQYHCDDL